MEFPVTTLSSFRFLALIFVAFQAVVTGQDRVVLESVAQEVDTGFQWDLRINDQRVGTARVQADQDGRFTCAFIIDIPGQGSVVGTKTPESSIPFVGITELSLGYQIHIGPLPQKGEGGDTALLVHFEGEGGIDFALRAPYFIPLPLTDDESAWVQTNRPLQ